MNLQLNSFLDVKKKINITIAVTLAVSLCLYFFLLDPVMDAIKKKKETISNLKIEMVNNREKALNMDILTNKLQKIEPQLEKLDSAVVMDSSGLDFIVAVENIAKKNDIEQHLDLKPQIADTSNANYQKTPLSIMAEGKLDDIYDYLDDLESMNYYFNIEEFSIEANDMENTKKANLKLDGWSYWKK